MNIFTMPINFVNTKCSYISITLLWNTYKDVNDKTIYIDFKLTKIIEPSMMSSLGMVLTVLSKSTSIYFINLFESIKTIFIQKKFISTSLSLYNEIPQNHVVYNSLCADDNDSFREYIMNNLKEINDLEKEATIKNIIMEIFINIKMHASNKISSNAFKNKEVFFDVDYYKQDNSIIVSIANNGLTFADSINNNINLELNQECEYIKWSMSNYNSKDIGSGGGGLFRLINFIRECNGKLIIVSGYGFYKFNGDISDNGESLD